MVYNYIYNMTADITPYRLPPFSIVLCNIFSCIQYMSSLCSESNLLQNYYIFIWGIFKSILSVPCEHSYISWWTQNLTYVYVQWFEARLNTLLYSKDKKHIYSHKFLFFSKIFILPIYFRHMTNHSALPCGRFHILTHGYKLGARQLALWTTSL